MKLLDELYNPSNQRVNFDYFESSPLFQPFMQNLTEQGFHHEWHNEGCVLNHMKNVHNEMCKLCKKNNIDGVERKILVLSAFLHDIGKAVTGYMRDNGDWSFPHHAKKGMEIFMDLCKDTDDDRELVNSIAYFIRYHMKPNYIVFSRNKKKDIIKLAAANIFNSKYCTLKNLKTIKLADYLGCFRAMEDDTNEALEVFEKEAKDLDLYDNILINSSQYKEIKELDYFGSLLEEQD